MAILLASFITGLVGALLVTPLARAVAIRIDRRLRPYHVGTRTTRVPRLGGVAIFLALVASGFYLARASDWLSIGEQHQLVGLLLGGGIVLAVGIYGDIHRVEPGWRLAWGVLAAAVAISYDAWLVSSSTPAVSLLLAAVVFVATPNVIKLGDRAEGLTAGVVAIAAGCLGLLSWLVGSHLGIGLALGCIGALAGFLRYHYQPVRAVFGDGGSALLGFVLAGLTIVVVSRSPTGLAWLGTIVILAVPLADAGIGIVRAARITVGRLGIGPGAGGFERLHQLQERRHG